MPLKTRINRRRSFFTKSRGPFAKSAVTRTQRRARTLMSLASLFGFCAVVWWLMIALIVWSASGAISIAPPSWQKLLEYWHWAVANEPVNASMLALAWLLTLVATLAPIVCLRRLGYALYTQAPLSFIVAQRFAWLGRALVANIAIGFVAGSIAASQLKGYDFSFSLGFWGTVLAAILAYVVADMIREGARASEEHREFV